MLSEGTDVTIVYGHIWKRLAAEALEAKGISAEVINIHTIKPLDEEAILKSLAKQNVSLLLKSTILGGLGESSRVLALNNQLLKSLLLMTVSVSLEPALMEKYKLTIKRLLKQ
jgi:transketolase